MLDWHGTKLADHGSRNVEFVQSAHQHEVPPGIKQSVPGVQSCPEERSRPSDVPHSPRHAVVIGESVVAYPESLVPGSPSIVSEALSSSLGRSPVPVRLLTSHVAPAAPLVEALTHGNRLVAGPSMFFWQRMPRQMPDERDRPGDLPFPDAIEPFVRACPGPALAIGALRVVAHQPINGIAGLELDPAHKKPAPVRTLNRAASAVFCTADHLSKAAAHYGFSILLAIRWITFSAGVRPSTTRSGWNIDRGAAGFLGRGVLEPVR